MRGGIAYPSGYDSVRILRLAGTPMNWKKMEERARRDLQYAAKRIEDGRLGEPSKRRNNWKVGKSPGASKGIR